MRIAPKRPRTAERCGDFGNFDGIHHASGINR
jgi:hypothetical protein